MVNSHAVMETLMEKIIETLERNELSSFSGASSKSVLQCQCETTAGTPLCHGLLIRHIY